MESEGFWVRRRDYFLDEEKSDVFWYLFPDENNKLFNYFLDDLLFDK